MEEKFISDFDHLPEEGKKEVLKKLLFEKIRAETKQRLKTDASIQKYFEQFNKNSIDFFIGMYAVKKASWMTSAESLATSSEFIDMKYDRAAKYALGLILKRKAMQKIAEWNAYQAEFDGIETSIDFALWDADIFNIPCIEPVERQEVDIYIRYFLSPDFSEDDNINLPTSYLILRRDASMGPDDDGGNDFCVLYDTLKGAGTYLILPPEKTTIERSYEDRLRNHRVAQQERDIAEGKKQPYIRDERPSIHSSDSQAMTEFIRRFENSEVMQKYRAHAHFYEEDIKSGSQLREDEELEWNLKNMLRHDEAIPIQSHPDLREALKLSFKEFEKIKTVAAIETAYENYLFRINNKMTFERDEEKIERAKDWIKRTKEHLIEARVFAGEPADLKMF